MRGDDGDDGRDEAGLHAGDVWKVSADCGGETSGWRMVGMVAPLSWG